MRPALFTLLVLMISGCDGSARTEHSDVADSENLSDTPQGSDTTPASDDTPSDAAQGSPRFLCESTGGVWETTETADCGHSTCGQVNCDAVVTHSEYCVCDVRARFDAATGCAYEPTCLDREQQLCEATGGVWDPSACRHDVCGMPSGCKALIPGCKCGAGKIFDPPGTGCVDSADCG